MRQSVAVAVALTFAVPVLAQSVEIRVVERTGQSVVDASDNVLNFAVQARVTSGQARYGLSQFGFSVLMPSEGATAGSFARDRITDTDFTYYSGIAGPAAGTNSGIAHQWGYLAGINPNFNGLLNQDGSTWTQHSYQDIGLIVGSALQQNLLDVPGVDTDFDGNPDTAVGTTATLPPSIMGTYFGAGQFVDIYRFRYIVADFTPRSVTMQLANADGINLPDVWAFRSLVSNNLTWGTSQSQIANPTVSGFTFTVVPSPGCGTFLAGATFAAMRPRRRSGQDMS